ncbi:MAG TPA: carboxypeptidase regulatory-like domain-containing protein [Deltaproteobacteria bacterium]|nr:carboxypeptidase regulatory-like domain-containing protein [Deltaproteobacteria bacterium]
MDMRWIPIGLSPWVWGCTQPMVQLSGTIYSSHEPSSPPQAGARVTVVDLEGGILDEAETDEGGRFSVLLPEGLEIIAEIRGEGLATATFPGISGIDPFAELEDRSLYAVSLEEVEAERARFLGCPGAEEPSALLFGEMRLHGLVDPETGENPTVNTGRIDVRSAAGGQWSACYLDADGAAYDPEAPWTGDSGRFAVFGIGAGLHDIDARYEFFEGYWVGEIYAAWVPPEDEVVAIPGWPVLVPFDP